MNDDNEPAWALFLTALWLLIWPVVTIWVIYAITGQPMEF